MELVPPIGRRAKVATHATHIQRRRIRQTVPHRNVLTLALDYHLIIDEEAAQGVKITQGYKGAQGQLPRLWTRLDTVTDLHGIFTGYKRDGLFNLHLLNLIEHPHS